MIKPPRRSDGVRVQFAAIRGSPASLPCAQSGRSGTNRLDAKVDTIQSCFDMLVLANINTISILGDEVGTVHHG